MQAVILAAGLGTRMGDLTKDTPKPMLKVRGKTLLEWKLERLPKEIDEVILVIGYKGELIQDYFKDKFGRFNIKYVWQKELTGRYGGTFGALMLCKDTLHDKFLVMMGDDIYEQSDLEKMLQYEESILVFWGNENSKGGRMILDEENNWIGLNEGMIQDYPNIVSNYLNTGCYFLKKDIFELKPVLAKEGEYGIPHTLISDKSRKIKAILTEKWLNLTSPEDLKKAEDIIT